MRVCLIGADFEENLGVGMIAAVATKAGHQVTVLPYNYPDDRERIVLDVVQSKFDVVGLSIQFQHRAHEFLSLSRRLRTAGYRGHITTGGQFPTLAWVQVLDPANGVDSVVLHEGEQTFPELLNALSKKSSLSSVAGLAIRDEHGVAVRTSGRRLEESLDSFPFPTRYRPHSKHVGVDFVPIMGGRGCWGSCSYCSITSFYRDARAHGGGKTVRLRSPENIAEEMAMQYHTAGNHCVFCFHDDNLLLPRPSDTLTRIRTLREHLDRWDVGNVGLVGKCRPDCVTGELAKELRKLGVLRLYVGVENAAEEGASHLGRESQAKHIDQALRACYDAGIFVCYNLLIFEPDSTLDDIEKNVQFIRDHREHPVNFCRAEPYFGTPLHKTLIERDTLSGSYLGFNYAIGESRSELMFRICSAAFRQRNFDSDGVGNRYMGLGYTAKLVEFYYPENREIVRKLSDRAQELTRLIANDTADWLSEVLAFVRTVELTDSDKIARFTANLGLKIAAADAIWHQEMDRWYREINAYVEHTKKPFARYVSPQLLTKIRNFAAGVSMAAWASTLPGCGSTVVDPVPTDSSVDRQDLFVVDPAPVDSSMEAVVVDPPPPDAGRDVQMDEDIFVVDPPPPDAGQNLGVLEDLPGTNDTAQTKRRLGIIDQWTDTTAKSIRSTTMALYHPPTVNLSAKRDQNGVMVQLSGAVQNVSTRWEGDGEILSDHLMARWVPGGAGDQIRVAVRSAGGVTILSLRSSEL